MTTRFAGDFFGVPLASTGGSSSEIMKYFPSLRKPTKASPVVKKEEKAPTAKLTGGFSGVASFGGFKATKTPSIKR